MGTTPDICVVYFAADIVKINDVCTRTDDAHGRHAEQLLCGGVLQDVAEPESVH